MLIETLHLSRFLSFGNAGSTLNLGPLNVLIGPNGSGKSNLLEALSLLKAAPRELLAPIRDGGGVRDWLWKGERGAPVAELDAVVRNPRGPQSLRYHLAFTEVTQRFELTSERIEFAQAEPGKSQPYFHYRFERGHGVLNVHGHKRKLQREDVDPSQSILSQRRDPDHYPEISALARAFDRIRLYREWSFGRFTAPRLPQKADLPNDMLSEDCSNLGLVLNRLRRDPAVKAELLDGLRVLYEGIDDYDVQIEGGTVQVFFHENRRTIPATRLSDGTLRYLCLLAILCHPDPPPLVGIEEPELGLHPDVLPKLADLLRKASERCQLVVTTHSDVLVDAMTETPEAIVVVERKKDGTTMQRLDPDQLRPWLQEYRLGTLWTRGDLGGTRW